MRKQFSLFATCLLGLLLCTSSLFAQYNKCAGQNVIYDDYNEFSAEEIQISSDMAPKQAEQLKAKRSKMLRDANSSTKVVEKKNEATGEMEKVVVERKKVSTDAHGNALGSGYDLAIDGAFTGETIAVLHLYTGEGFDFSLPTAALKEKGFGIYRWQNNPPPADEMERVLKKCGQLWIISSSTRKLDESHLKVIKKFFNEGKGVYIWGDNEPYYADANYVGAALLDITMTGNTYGDQTVGLKEEKQSAGILQNHLITTGMNYVYEGITIATIDNNKHMEPLIWGSAGNVVAAVYEHDGKRAIFDGGFTRLYVKWDTAGTGRYVKNAAAWLMNVENRGYDGKK